MSNPPIPPDDSDLMEGDISESDRRRGIRRLNNVPLWIGGSIGVLFILMMVYVMSLRSNPDSPTGPGQRVTTTTSAANQIPGMSGIGIIDPLKPPAPENAELKPGTTGTSAVIKIEPPPTDLSIPPLPPGTAQAPGLAGVIKPPTAATPPIESEESRRIRMFRQQMLERAIAAKLTGAEIKSEKESPNNQMTSNAGGDDLGNGFMGQLNNINNASSSGDATNNNATANNAFLSQSVVKGDRWHLGQRRVESRTSYELRAGFVIPAVLVSGVNSELPGQIVAQVSNNVYDSASGNNLLIPTGSRLVGNYSSNVQYGQSRVLVTWQRVVFPDGSALDIGGMPGSDSAGFAGFNDKVDNHYFRIFGSALLMSGIVAGVSMSQDNTSDSSDSSNGNSASSAMSQALGQQLGQVSAEMIRKNMAIAPTLEIRPGYRFNVVVTKDLTFSESYTPRIK